MRLRDVTQKSQKEQSNKSLYVNCCILMTFLFCTLRIIGTRNCQFSICLLWWFLIRRRHPRIVQLRVLGSNFITPPQNKKLDMPRALICGIQSTWQTTSTMTIYINQSVSCIFVCPPSILAIKGVRMVCPHCLTCIHFSSKLVT